MRKKIAYQRKAKTIQRPRIKKKVKQKLLEKIKFNNNHRNVSDFVFFQPTLILSYLEKSRNGKSLRIL
jgi:hypothetical protein